MKPATERKIIRLLHILVSVPLAGYLYGPVSSIPEAVFVLRWFLFPLVVLSGLWMWKGHLVRKAIRMRH